jgi:hypothetical protein
MAIEADNGTSKDAEVDDAAYGDFAHWASTDEGNSKKASLATNENDTEWVLDSGASKHVAGKSCVFESCHKHPPPSHTYRHQNDHHDPPSASIGEQESPIYQPPQNSQHDQQQQQQETQQLENRTDDLHQLFLPTTQRNL